MVDYHYFEPLDAHSNATPYLVGMYSKMRCEFLMSTSSQTKSMFMEINVNHKMSII